MKFWNSFAEKHPKAAQWIREGGLFILVCNLITIGKTIALIFLPLAVTMLIPLFTIKEPSTKDGVLQGEGVGRPAGFIESSAFALKHKHFTYWLFILAVMNFGLQGLSSFL